MLLLVVRETSMFFKYKVFFKIMRYIVNSIILL